jgi:hypothetical protein
MYISFAGFADKLFATIKLKSNPKNAYLLKSTKITIE